MKGSRQFTQTEFEQIRALLSQKVLAARDKQKSIRSKLRRHFDFHISNYGFSPEGFGPRQLDELLIRGAIKIIGKGAPRTSEYECETKSTTPKQADDDATVSRSVRASKPVAKANLQPYLRPGLDVLFVALNPPAQSNANAHYFSGSGSRFFKLLDLSGLTTKEIPKAAADEIVFGSTDFNHKNAQFGVVDLVEDLVETNSASVRPQTQHVDRLIGRIREYEPRFICLIHSKVRAALNTHPAIHTKLEYGVCGPVLEGSETLFVLNYFPNGNSIPDGPKLEIFRALRDLL